MGCLSAGGSARPAKRPFAVVSRLSSRDLGDVGFIKAQSTENVRMDARNAKRSVVKRMLIRRGLQLTWINVNFYRFG